MPNDNSAFNTFLDLAKISVYEEFTRKLGMVNPHHPERNRECLDILKDITDQAFTLTSSPFVVTGFGLIKKIKPEIIWDMWIKAWHERLGEN